MKAIVSLVCILVLVTISKCLPLDSEFKEQMKGIYTKCKSETQAEEGPVEMSTKKMESTTPRKNKCMMACVMRESGMIKNGKFDVAGALKMSEKLYFSKKEDMEKVKTAAEICEKQVASETDECDLAEKIAICLSDEFEKVGLKPATLG